MIKLKENPVEGKTIKMGGSDIIVPPLNLKRLQQHTANILAMDEEKDPIKRLAASCAVVHSALQRNYPEITLDEVEELVDMGNLQAVTLAVMGQWQGQGEQNPA